MAEQHGLGCFVGDPEGVGGSWRASLSRVSVMPATVSTRLGSRTASWWTVTQWTSMTGAQILRMTASAAVLVASGHPR